MSITEAHRGGGAHVRVATDGMAAAGWAWAAGDGRPSTGDKRRKWVVVEHRRRSWQPEAGGGLPTAPETEGRSGTCVTRSAAAHEQGGDGAGDGRRQHWWCVRGVRHVYGERLGKRVWRESGAAHRLDFNNF
jgi:hypothetical protein